ncbi:UDP-N-acetylmuramoyl-L-alanine--D-glutamate ligase [Candidatus Uhrbacteria bacterium]|nr:UDP-N-acetylmuramoyl-L-alanine--D-glutamate ligase [Candidatus Uhrbacteria bacterium]
MDLSSIKNFQDAAVTVMGLGRYKKGSGVGTAKWLMRHGAQLIITDLKDKDELCEAVDEIMDAYTEYRSAFKDRDIYQPVFVLGKHDVEHFTDVDVVVQNPDVARESEFVQLAREQGVSVESDISLFFRFCPFPIYTVTGTRGKSTTTALLGEMLKRQHPGTVIAGNITHSPLEDLDQLLEAAAPVPIVLELSSWLLESLEGLGRGPAIAILTNAHKDHLDRYDSFEHYVRAKELIFQEQTSEQVAIFNADQEIMHDIAGRVPSKRVQWFSSRALPEGMNGVYREGDAFVRRMDGVVATFMHVHDLKLEGEHNLMNALAASLAAHEAGVSDEDIHATLKAFTGLPGRQEILGEVEGVLFVNDTTGTSPEGVMAALKRFGKGGNILLICGGSSKGLGFSELGKMIGEQCKFVVVFEGTAADDLERAIGEGAPTVRVDSMAAAVKAAVENAALGDVILLSPGTSSFDIFKNEFDRGDQFNAEFQKRQKA